MLGVETGWGLRALLAVGNYGEMFERNRRPRQPAQTRARPQQSVDAGRADVRAAGALTSGIRAVTDLQIYITLGVFAGVILAIAINLIDMALAVMLGASVLIVLGILTQGDILHSIQSSDRHAGAAVRRHGGGAHAQADRHFRVRRRALSARHARQRQALPAPADRADRADLRGAAERHHGHSGRAHHHPRRRSRSRSISSARWC